MSSAFTGATRTTDQMTTDLKTICFECGSDAIEEVLVNERAQINHDGTVHEVRADVLALKCTQCNVISYDFRADRAFRSALREQLGLLQPERIRELRTQFRKTQKDVASDIRIAEETLSRWECDHVMQSASHDKLLRFYFEKLEQLSAPLECATSCGTYEARLRSTSQWVQANVVPEPDPSHSKHTVQYALAA